MRLDRLDLTRYGKFTDYVIDLGVSTAAEKCAKWRRNGVPVGLIKKGLEALVDRYAV